MFSQVSRVKSGALRLWVPHFHECRGEETEHQIVSITAKQEKELEYIPLVMVREDLTMLSPHPAPAGYRLRYYRRGEDHLWADIWMSLGSFESMDRALAYFEEEFGPGRDEMEARCLFLEAPTGRAIGTTTSWYNECFQGKGYGRIHWVGIHPDHQGKKLGKPLLAASMERLAELHDRAYLTTQTTSARAICMYLDLEFVPFRVSDACRRGWRLLASVLEHPALETYRES